MVACPFLGFGPGIRFPSKIQADSRSPALCAHKTQPRSSHIRRRRRAKLLKGRCRRSLTNIIAGVHICSSTPLSLRSAVRVCTALGRRGAMSASFLASSSISSSHSLGRRTVPSVCSAHSPFGGGAARCQHQCALSRAVSWAPRSSYLGAMLATPPGLAPSRYRLHGFKSCFGLSPVADVVLRACCRAGKALFTWRCEGVHALWLSIQGENAIEQLQFIMQYPYPRIPSIDRDLPACTDTGFILWGGGA